ncbi:phosphate ABC transporter substrate-binding protein [Vibrio ostreicida]|uniref:Phosphate-binding protein n=1 Tax=Vibrio ostreicida TaxID=526588 RepID=A0ABT8BZA7_9VIBR|nr:phosphate ABC transporter substrate-binding protein [Vibrio ostreicida]MDN3612497.1 phosphate ABC transporter substrate-binding protein [Vibrio ostreicida]NPD10204.1 phosphate ABC transporter substrate-binding protein [Vibrio ostreicida]
MVRFVLAALLSCYFFIFSAHASEVNVSGSTSVARIMDVLAEKFNATHPATYIAVQGVGSTAGITLLKKGIADIGMTSRYLTDSEQDATLTVTPLALDGLAVVVNKFNQLNNITREQLFDIYKGNITNWKQLGGADQKIAVVTREASSGSRYSFESLLGLTRVIKGRLVSDINPNNLVVNSNSMVKTLVSHNKQAIGFISTGSVDSSVKALDFEGVKASNDTIASHKYELSRPFLMLHKTGEQRQDVASFIKFIKGKQAKALISEYGYIPVIK